MVYVTLARNSNWGLVCTVCTGNFTKVYVWKVFGAVSVSAVGTGGVQPAALLSAARLQGEALASFHKVFPIRRAHFPH